MIYEHAREVRVMTLRETEVPNGTTTNCDTADKVYGYFKAVIAADPRHNADVEQFYVLMLNTRRRVVAHVLVGLGTLDSVLVHPREVFRAAIVQGASAIVIIHNHPSGDATPSEADIKITKELIAGGKLLKIDVLDHLVMGDTLDGRTSPYISLRGLGYFS